MEVVALIFAGIVFAVCFFAFELGGKSKRQRFIDKAKDKGNYTTAVYVESKTEKGNFKTDIDKYRASPSAYRNDTLWVKYEYEVRGKKFYKTYGFQSPGCASIDYPYRITVFYDIRNPKKAYADVEESEKQKKTRGWGLTIFFTLLIYGMVRNL